ncbi:PIN domain-containing protein [Pedobacter xixiisoli]|uniref:DUF4935 domain-containing protein n=1 Tax=Pedobacter xixiisoli TaxID=1476464 RepID=A0A285ZZS5_9SPHI|nr:PIN domain-containing protein [Pedobacter xixiisoli]SOD15140.1 hypothetical protein SAMN06297358_2115 [Pedobacter xixiisoli]
MFSVLIDTSAYEELRLSFKGDIFDSLINLSKEQKIIIVSSIIIYEEMKAHLKESIATSINKIDKVSKDINRLSFGDLGAITTLLNDKEKLKNDLLKERLDRIDTFFDNAKIETLDISDVDINQILINYFAIKPPFGEGGKRKEFPDAFILYAFVQEYKDHLDQTCIVSNDPDWKKFAEGYPQTRYFESIRKMIDFILSDFDKTFTTMLREAIEGKSELLVEEIIEQINDGSFSVDDSWINPDEELDISSVKVDILDFNIISYTGETANIEVETLISYELRLWAADETASYKDDDTKEWVYFGVNQYKAAITKKVVIETEYYFDSHPTTLKESLGIGEVSIPDEVFYADDEERFELIKHWADEDYRD